MFSRHTEARHARNVAVFDLVEAFTEANIPGKANIHGKVGSSQLTLILTEPHSKPWFIAWISASSHRLSKNVWKSQRATESTFVSCTSVAIVTDEASDAQDRFGLHILFITEVDTTSELSPAAYLADIVYLEKVNAVTVSQAVLTCVANMGASCNNVSAFVTDNASYMSKAFEKMIGILPNAVHCTCNTHILSLIGETWRKKLQRLWSSCGSIQVYFYLLLCQKVQTQGILSWENWYWRYPTASCSSCYQTHYVQSHSTEGSLLPSMGPEMSTCQSAVMLCNLGVKAGWFSPLVDKCVIQITCAILSILEKSTALTIRCYTNFLFTLL